MNCHVAYSICCVIYLRPSAPVTLFVSVSRLANHRYWWKPHCKPLLHNLKSCAQNVACHTLARYLSPFPGHHHFEMASRHHNTGGQYDGASSTRLVGRPQPDQALQLSGTSAVHAQCPPHSRRAKAMFGPSSFSRSKTAPNTTTPQRTKL